MILGSLRGHGLDTPEAGPAIAGVCKFFAAVQDEDRGGVSFPAIRASCPGCSAARCACIVGCAAKPGLHASRWVPALRRTASALHRVRDTVENASTSPHSRAAFSPGLLQSRRSSRKERRRESRGADCARTSCAPEHTGSHVRSTWAGLQVQPRHPGFPRAMALRLIRALPGEWPFLPPSLAGTYQPA